MGNVVYLLEFMDDSMQWESYGAFHSEEEAFKKEKELIKSKKYKNTWITEIDLF